MRNMHGLRIEPLRLCQTVSQVPLSNWNLPHTPTQVFATFSENLKTEISPVQVFDFQAVHSLKTDCELSYLLATAHATWHHSGFTQVGTAVCQKHDDLTAIYKSQICGLLDLVRDRLVPLIETEEQMLFVFHLVGPFLQRLHADR